VEITIRQDFNGLEKVTTQSEGKGNNLGEKNWINNQEQRAIKVNLIDIVTPTTLSQQHQ